MIYKTNLLLSYKMQKIILLTNFILLISSNNKIIIKLLLKSHNQI